MCATPEIVLGVSMRAQMAQQAMLTEQRRQKIALGAEPLPPFSPQPPRQPKLTHLERLEQRYADLEREAAKVAVEEKKAAACASCLWARDLELIEYGGSPLCAHPLVKGFGQAKYCQLAEVNTLCTDERLLWEPRPTRWQRFITWIEGLFA